MCHPFDQAGVDSLKGKSLCDHLQVLLHELRDDGKITVSTSGPPEPDQSLLNNAEFWKDVASVQLNSPGGYPHQYGKLATIYTLARLVTQIAFGAHCSVTVVHLFRNLSSRAMISISMV